MAIDFITDPVGTKYGCKYTYTGSNLGTFSGLFSAPTDGRRVKDPLNIFGSYFVAVDPADLGILNITDIIELKTKRIFKSNESILLNGSEFVTKEDIDINNYKYVASFNPASSASTLVGIPKDQLFVTKELLNTSDFATGINKITMTVSNMNVKVALSTDNKNWVTYNSTTDTWDEVILNTKYLEQLKTKMMDYTELNALTQDKYDKYFNAQHLGIALLCYIDGTDTTKKYSIDSIILDYVGDQDEKTPTVQYFNFIKVGYKPNGNVILLADRTVQQGISYKQLFTAELTNFGKKCELSTTDFPMYYGLPQSSVHNDDNEDEWKALLDPSYTDGKELYDFYNTAIASFTQAIAVEKDDENRDAGTNDAPKIICRGANSAMGFNNVDLSSSDKWFGWRPMLVIDLQTPIAKYPPPVLPVVNEVAEIAKGKCISCDYIVTTPSYIGTFENLGKARLGLLSDYTNRASGSFYFVCVGYTRDKGYPILVADRNIHTGVSLENTFKFNEGSNTGEYGITTQIDLTKYQVRLPGALAHTEDYENAVDEWDSIIHDMDGHSRASIFHDDKTLSWTRTFYENTYETVVRGISKHQRHMKSGETFSSTGIEEVGYRPILILEPKISITNLLVTPYVGYKVHKAASQFKCEISIVDSNNEPVEYWLELKSDGTILSPKSKDTTRIIAIDSLPENTASTVSIVYGSGINPNTGEEVKDVLYSFDVYRDKDYRLTTTRSFGKYYGGFEGDGATPFGTEAKPTTSKQTPIKTNEHGRYIDVSNFASKITF